MKKRVLALLAVIVVLFSSLAFSVDAGATSRTDTTELTGAARTVEEAAVLGATRSTVATDAVTASEITDQNAAKGLLDLELIARILSAYTGREIKASDISILDSMDITPAAGVEVSAKNPLFVTFKFSGITSKTKAYVIHYANNTWEVVPTTVSDETVVGEFTSLSPVAIVLEKNSLKSGVLGANRSKSARTGDYRYYIVSTVVVLGILGFVFAKKYKNA